MKSYLTFVRENAPFLGAGALLMMLSSFGQTSFISIFGGDIRTEFGLTNGEWGIIYMIGTTLSAAIMLAVGGVVDRFRVRVVGIVVVLLLALACLGMAFNVYAAALPFVILSLRFFGQGMSYHASVVALSRWFIATRGRALATASVGYMAAEATLPLTFVWLKGYFAWKTLWIGCAIFAVMMTPVLYRLLRLERTPQAVSAENDAFGMDGRHWTRGDALLHPLFWALIPAITLSPAFVTAFWFHQVHFAALKGWEHLTLVAVFPVGTITVVIFTFVYGNAIDKFGAGRLFPFFLLPLVIAFTLHWYAPSVAWSAAGVMFMGMAGGGMATLPAAIWATYYGTRNLGSIKSVVAALMVLGSAIGPGLSGWLIDVGIDFDVQMLAYAASFLFASVVCVIPLRLAAARLPAAA
ncbi:MFS transporter [Yoonia sediminilitoris]|uniref:MFS transporter n=1 Tax=Yoonia sediminilitoris TaxID=1286148 RepID=A0A2T6KLU4_9RHOB|nr:MFS transporter [Yoonia sediminilitoris]PUB17190.1 MFS transporter [Yoonia sediminilitoris]RCW97485.1 MFS transporter [Yoonia sediminilitoris]